MERSRRRPIIRMQPGPESDTIIQEATDPVAQREQRVVGVTTLPLRALAQAQHIHRSPVTHLCCPEVNEWAIATPIGNRRFHLSGGPLPAIPNSRPVRELNRSAPPIPLRALGFLVTSTLEVPWTGLLLWGDGHGVRAGEEIQQDRVATAVMEGRTWTEPLGRLCPPTGRSRPQASAAKIQGLLSDVLPYCVSERLNLI